MYISYRIQDLKNLVIPITKIHKISKTIRRRRPKQCPSTKRNLLNAKTIIGIRGFRRPFILTLSPQAHRKLSLKYENIHNIKLYPDTISKSAEYANRDNDHTCAIYQISPLAVDSANEEQEMLLNERETLTSMKALLEEKLKQEQNKHETLKNFNEVLKFDLSNATTKTLELSIDKRSLEDEIQKITWQWNCKFVIPYRNRKIYKKLWLWIFAVS